MKNKLDFKDYLQEKIGHTKNTSRYKNNIVNEYLQWLQENEIKIKKMTYSNLLDYIGHLQRQNKSKSTINYCLKTISVYNNYLVLSGVEVKDIAKAVQLRGITQTHTLFLAEEELKSIYENFESYNTKGHYMYSDKLILSLMIYQALDERDIFSLEINHIKLGDGTLYVPSNPRRKESRTLALEAHQILAFKEYIDNYRKPFHKNHSEEISEKLFSPNADKVHRLHDQIKLMLKALKETAIKTNINITKLYTLRQSRIAIWIKQYGLRKAQYLAGYKTVASVELYQINDISDLQEQIKLLHPLAK
jgi:integrase/recombinase XerD